jgi:hypothetical protein
MSGLYQVIIKNTNAFKETASSASINRSQSLLTTNRIPVLAPSRADRIRLETLLADVWTKEILPFPGMTGRARSEHLVRASASSMMRKLSVASIASNFTKRSGSMASLHKTAEDDESGETDVMRFTPVRSENTSSESSQYKDLDDPTRSRLSVIQDEKENAQYRNSLETPGTLSPAANGSPASTLRRLATLKVKTSWGPDGQRMITPPLRTSSANSVNQNRVTSLSTVTDLGTEEKENIPHVQSALAAATSQKQGKKAKGKGISRTVVTEGIRSLFR